VTAPPTHSVPPAPPVPPADMAAWHRLHPLSPLIRTGRHLVALGILVLFLIFANHSGNNDDFISDIVVVGIVLVAGVISWLVTRWQVADGVLRIETGLIRRQSLRFPLSQVQAIDVVQTGLARVFGLAELRLRMAGADSSGGRLACLPLADAERLREQLLAMGHATARPTAPAPGAAGQVGAAGPAGVAGPASAPAPPRPERVLFRVQSERLAGAIILSRPGAYAGTAIAVVILVITLTGKPGIIVPFGVFGFGIVTSVWRQFNTEFGSVVAEAPDGLRLRSGLIQTAAETIRPGRVQAVRLVEPLFWRAFGWCRLEVDVAGPRQRRENRSEGQRLRALIPVGSRADADRMLGELLTAPPRPTHPAPATARVKTLLSYHFLAYAGDDRYVVASRGRICRKTTWVPLEKVQSVRWVQGPWQRRVGLATVRLDVAGRRVTASIQDRSVAEADELLARLPDLARAARSRRVVS
jgi:putative membrane protein